MKLKATKILTKELNRLLNQAKQKEDFKTSILSFELMQYTPEEYRWYVNIDFSIYIFDDAYDCGYEEAFQLEIFNNNIETWRKDIMENYFDFESFGKSIGNDECHYTLPDGRIVSLSY